MLFELLKLNSGKIYHYLPNIYIFGYNPMPVGWQITKNPIADRSA